MTDRRVLVVTGGARGIGRAVCKAAAAEGMAVAFSYLSDDTAASATMDEIGAAGGEVLAVKADVADPGAVADLFDRVDARFGRIDGLVNNAGITGPAGPFAESDPAVVDRVFRVNVDGTLACCRAAIARMALSRGGHGGAIVNVSSGAADTGAPGIYVWYGAAKAAVESFSRGLANEVAADGIRVNCVSPGVTDTEIHAASGRDLAVAGRTIPLGRVARPDEIARPIMFLLSESASYVVGAVLRVGGGR